MSEPPIELPDGQDEPPNLRLLLTELRRHLFDVTLELPAEGDLTLRNIALLRAIRRYRQAHFAEED